jgi:hypothetical protein
MSDTPVMVFSGNANLALSEGIGKKLNKVLGTDNSLPRGHL